MLAPVHEVASQRLVFRLLPLVLQPGHAWNVLEYDAPACPRNIIEYRQLNVEVGGKELRIYPVLLVAQSLLELVSVVLLIDADLRFTRSILLLQGLVELVIACLDAIPVLVIFEPRPER